MMSRMGWTSHGSAVPTMLTWRYVGFTGQVPNTTWTTNSTKSSQLYRLPDWIMSDSDQVVVWWDNWAFTGSEVNGPTHVIDKVSIEINGVAVPVTFSASRTKSMAAGDALVVSDAIPASSFGLTYIPRGTAAWIKGVGHTTGVVSDLTRDRGIMNAAGGGAIISGSICGYYQPPGDSTDTNQVDTTGAWNIGAITTGGGAVATNVHLPSGIIGRTTSTAQPMVALVDSLGDGYLAFNFNGSSDTGGMLRAAAWTAQKPYFTIGKFGSKPSQYSTKSSAMAQAQYSSSRLFYAGILENLANEFDGVNTIAAIETTVQAIWTVLADATHGGARPVYAFEVVIPNQTSTAGATTYPSQTKFAGGPAYFEAFNTWLATKGPAGDNTVQGILAWTGMFDAANSNKITVISKSWTLGTTISSGATVLRLNGASAPIAGEGVWLGGAGAEAAMVGSVAVVTPGSVWDATLYATANTSLNLSGATANGHTSGAAVNASYQPFDLAHFTQNGHSAVATSYAGTAPFQ